MQRKLFPPYTRRYALLSVVSRGWRLLRRGGVRVFARQLTRPDQWWARAKTPPVLDDLDANYAAWLTFQPALDRVTLAEEIVGWTGKPLISILMPVYNPAESDFREALESVRAQVYPYWQLCIVDDASSEPHVERLLRSQEGDDRVTIARRTERGGISAATNSALELARGEYVALMDHDDLLAPEAIAEIVRWLDEHPETDIVYSDEDKLDPSGKRVQPALKPDWSPSLLLSMNYITHLAVLRRSLVVEIGGFRTEYDGSQDYDLLLRATERANAISHVPRVLYSWRMTRSSAAGAAAVKPWALSAGRRALEDAVSRRGLGARVEDGIAPGRFRVRYNLRGRPLVSIVIPTRDRLPLLERCLASIERSSYPRREIVIVDNDSAEAGTLRFLDACGHRVVRSPGAFNFSRLVNGGVRAAAGEHLLLLNNDTEARDPDWIEAMLEHSQLPGVGAVGARLSYPGGRAQHEGVAVGAGEVFACHLDWRGYLDLGDVVREVSAVTAACMMTSAEAWQTAGGFDERFAVGYGDVDYCLRLGKLGHRIIYTPYARLVHVEGGSRGRGHPVADDRAATERWGPAPSLRDPYYNAALDRVLRPFAIDSSAR